MAWFTNLISGYALDSLEEFFVKSLYLIFSVLGKGISWTASALDYALRLKIYPDIAIIKEMWTLLRDFSNMLFVVILIVMAFATIFDLSPNVSKYSFGKMIGRFVVVAILINFSLVIGGLIIDVFQLFNSTFLVSIGNAGDRIGQFLNPAELLPPAGQLESKIASIGKTADITLSLFISLIFALIAAAIYFFSLVVATLFALIRVPYIWVLLVISPLAWMSWILPNTEKFFKKWWTDFIGWNAFLPIYLFFLYLGLLFLSQKNKVIAAIGGAPTDQSLELGVFNSYTFSLAFFYLFTGWFMINGAKFAYDISKTFGSGFDKGFDRAKSWTWKMPGFRSYAAAERAAQQKLGQIQKQGLQGRLGYIYGGEAAEARRQAKYAERYFGIEGEKDKQLSSDIGTWKSRFKNISDNELRARINTGPQFQRLAAREILKEKGLLNSAELMDTYNIYKSSNAVSAEKFANSADYGKMNAGERRDWYRQLDSVELKRKVVNAMADKGDLTTVPDITRYATIFTDPDDRAAFLKKTGNRLTNPSALRPLMTTGTPQEQLAVREVLTEKGVLSSNEMLDTYRLHGDGTSGARDYSKKIKYEDLLPAERRAWFTSPDITDVETKRKAAEAMADKGEFANVNELHGAATSLYQTQNTQLEFIKKVQKKQFIEAMEARSRIRGTTVANEIQDFVNRTAPQTTPNDLAELPVSAWANADFIAAAQARRTALQAARGPGVGRGGRPTPGAGDQFKSNILKAASSDPAKLRAVSAALP